MRQADWTHFGVFEGLPDARDVVEVGLERRGDPEVVHRQPENDDVGATFKYTENGPVGLLTGKKVYVFAARGGMYAGTPNDTQTPFIRTFLSFLGMSDIEFVYAEGLAISEASKQQSLARAEAAIDALVEPELAAA